MRGATAGRPKRGQGETTFPTKAAAQKRKLNLSLDEELPRMVDELAAFLEGTTDRAHIFE